MKKKLGIILTICLLISISLIFVGCTNDKIEFNVQSKFQKTMGKFKGTGFGKNFETKTSDGVVIYKDTRYSDTNSNVNFGPKDINFDLRIK